MLTSIFTALGGQFIDVFFKNAVTLVTAYINKEITEAELNAKLRVEFFKMLGQIETSYAESITKTYATFMQAALQDPLVRDVWAFVAVSQTFVLLWHQVGIPALVFLMSEPGKPPVHYPSSGTTVDWAYLLVAGCVGFGAIALRGGPAGTSSAGVFGKLLSKIV